MNKFYLALGLGFCFVSGAAYAPIAAAAQNDTPDTMSQFAQVDVSPETDVMSQPQIQPQSQPQPQLEPRQELAWGYHGAVAPAYWGGLKPEYSVCSTGSAQSPVNIAQYVQEDLPALKPAYRPTPLNVTNTGNTIYASYAPGSFLNIGDTAYELKHIHFHTPSSHYIDGSPFAMEAHFIHQSASGEIAVIAVMFSVGAANSTIEAIWQNVPMGQGSRQVPGIGISASDIMPESPAAMNTDAGADQAEKGLEYYTYSGSLVTPPCAEGVRWIVLKNGITLSEEQLRVFQSIFPSNSRPIQPLNGRIIKGR